MLVLYRILKVSVNSFRYVAALDVDQLSPLLKGKYSPALDGGHDESNIKKLIDFIHGITDKPPLGEPPQVIQESSGGALGLSPAAEAIVKIMIEGSKNGRADAQRLPLGQVKEATDLEDDDIIDAVDELERQGYVKVVSTQGITPLDGEHVWAKNSLFVTFDKYFKPWNPEEDALTNCQCPLRMAKAETSRKWLRNIIGLLGE